MASSQRRVPAGAGLTAGRGWRVEEVGHQLQHHRGTPGARHGAAAALSITNCFWTGSWSEVESKISALRPVGQGWGQLGARHSPAGWGVAQAGVRRRVPCSRLQNSLLRSAAAAAAHAVHARGRPGGLPSRSMNAEPGPSTIPILGCVCGAPPLLSPNLASAPTPESVLPRPPEPAG